MPLTPEEIDQHKENLDIYIKRGGTLAADSLLFFAGNPVAFMEELRFGNDANVRQLTDEAGVTQDSAKRYQMLFTFARQGYDKLKDIEVVADTDHSSVRDVASNRNRRHHRRRS